MLFILYSNLWAATQEYEVTISQLYKEIEQNINPPVENEDITHQNSHIILNNAIELLKIAPNSSEAFCTLSYLDINYKFNDNALNIFKTLRSKHFASLNIVDKDEAEKLIFIRICLLFMPDVINAFPNENLKTTKKICFESLEKFKNECTNKDYSALATIILFLYDRKNEKGYGDFFKNNFPNHKALIFIELSKTTQLLINNDTHNCLEETFKLIQKHGTEITPDGYTFDVTCYSLIISCYIKLNDYNNAKKYLDFYEEKISAVNAELLKSSYVKNLKMQVENIQK